MLDHSTTSCLFYFSLWCHWLGINCTAFIPLTVGIQGFLCCCFDTHRFMDVTGVLWGEHFYWSTALLRLCIMCSSNTNVVRTVGDQMGRSCSAHTGNLLQTLCSSLALGKLIHRIFILQGYHRLAAAPLTAGVVEGIHGAGENQWREIAQDVFERESRATFLEP